MKELELDTDRLERIAKEIVVFASFRGGKIIFGIEDLTNEIKRISKTGFEEWIMDKVNCSYITTFLIPI